MNDRKFCKFCGTSVRPSARFCGNCGAALSEEPHAHEGAVNAKEYVNDGVSLYQQGDYEGALSKFVLATEFDATLGVAWSDKGCALGRLGDYQAALEAFNKALEIDPDNQAAKEGRELCLRMLGSEMRPTGE